MRKAVSISLESKILEKINKSKGKHEPRSRFIEDVLFEFLKNNKRFEENSPQTKTKQTDKGVDLSTE